MAEQDQQTQQSEEQQSNQQTQQRESNQNQEQNREEPRQNDNGAQVPSSRLREETRKRQEAEQKLQQYEQQAAQQEEQRAQQQGEYQQLAEKRKTIIEQKDARIKELENQIVQGERYRAFVSASQGVVLPEALDDAFSMLTEEEFKSADTQDPNTFRLLADSLVERKPYLADGVRGSGSGGSSRPVFSSGANGNRNGQRTASGRSRSDSPFNNKRQKPPYK